ncbi:ROK family transcriptional regulator [Actinacidiphila sp. bgisy145]|uniref:ROK family transcriptional regulator n=1 Tax=Actinacidiphila sp. bgisy145 TaxID=3413792 RepID=UPI003EBCE361
MTAARGPRSTAPVLGRALLAAFEGHDRLRRVDLMAATGLSRPVVTALLGKLVADGLLTPVPPEDGPAPVRGRPSPAYRLARAATCVALLRLFRGPTAFTLVTTDGPTAHRTLDVPWTGPWQEWCAAVRDVLGAAEAATGLHARHVVLALPLPVDASGDGPARIGRPFGRQLPPGAPAPLAALLRRWRQEDPRDQLSRTLGRTVHLVNDANLAALGEAHHGAAAHASSSLHLSVRDGLGAGIVIGGRIHHGALGTAGEIAHIPVVEDGPYCLCGKRGCLATQTLGADLTTAFSALYRRALTRTDVDAMLRAPDATANRYLDDLGRLLARPLASTITMLNPDVLVIDPELRAGHEAFTRGLATRIAPFTDPDPAGTLRIVPGALPEAHAYGALSLPRTTPATPL